MKNLCSFLFCACVLMSTALVSSCTTEEQFATTNPELRADLLKLADVETSAFTNRASRSGEEWVDTLSDADVEQLVKALDEICVKYKDLLVENPELGNLSEDTQILMTMDPETYVTTIKGRTSDDYYRICKKVMVDNETVTPSMIVDNSSLTFNERVSALTIASTPTGFYNLPPMGNKGLTCKQIYDRQTKGCNRQAISSLALLGLEATIEHMAAGAIPGFAGVGVELVLLGHDIYKMIKILDTRKECLKTAESAYDDCLKRSKRR